MNKEVEQAILKWFEANMKTSLVTAGRISVDMPQYSERSINVALNRLVKRGLIHEMTAYRLTDCNDK